MAQIIDFTSRKKALESKNKDFDKKNERSLTSFHPSTFQSVAERNKQAKEKTRKCREQANKNVLKSYGIK